MEHTSKAQLYSHYQNLPKQLKCGDFRRFQEEVKGGKLLRKILKYRRKETESWYREKRWKYNKFNSSAL